jgi:CheY-like chemotaxis protein
MQVTRIPTVMVADYSEDTRDVLKCWLEMKGCRVVEATDGRQAVELTKGDCPDLILMSMRMPLLGGLDAMRRIRERGKTFVFPIVAMSTYPTIEARASALAAGCASFIAQPIDFDVLSTVLSSLLPESVGEQSTELERTPIVDMFSIRRAHTVSA